MHKDCLLTYTFYTVLSSATFLLSCLLLCQIWSLWDLFRVWPLIYSKFGYLCRLPFLVLIFTALILSLHHFINLIPITVVSIASHPTFSIWFQQIQTRWFTKAVSFFLHIVTDATTFVSQVYLYSIFRRIHSSHTLYFLSYISPAGELEPPL